MKRILIAVLVVFFAMAAVHIGSSSAKEASWGSTSGGAFLAKLPPVPIDVCSADSAEIEQFQSKFAPLRKELDSNVAERQRSIRKEQEKNSKKMMENSVAMPGFEGKSQSEMNKMSKAERKKMAEKMMADKYGVTPDELKAQKKANEKGQVMANVDWAKAMAGEKQAEDLMKSKEQREADQKKIDDARRLTEEQSKLTPYVQGLRSKFQTEVAEIDQLPTGVEMKKEIAAAEKRLDEMQSDSRYKCRQLDEQKARLVNDQREYCAWYATQYKNALTGYRDDIQSFLPKHDRLDEVASELQAVQVGVPLSEASVGLSSLETVQDYAHLLGQVYQHNVGPLEKMRGFCDGQ